MRMFISRMAAIFMLIGCVLAVNAVLQGAISVWGALLVLPAFGWLTLRLLRQAARPARPLHQLQNTDFHRFSLLRFKSGAV